MLNRPFKTICTSQNFEIRKFITEFFQFKNVSFFSTDFKAEHKGLKGLIRLFNNLVDLNPTHIADLHSVLRTHFLRMDQGSFFPDHVDMQRMNFDYHTIRLTAFVNVNEYHFKWIYDDRLIKCNNGSIWFFNSHKKHSVFSTHDGMMIMVIVLKFDTELFRVFIEKSKVT